MSWQTVLSQIANNAEEQFEQFVFRLRRKIEGVGPVCILPYFGYGNTEVFRLRGRAFERYKVTSAHDNDTIWRNILNMYRRFNSYEIPNARIRARLGGETVEVTANADGYFDIEVPVRVPLVPGHLWHELELELVEYPDQPGAKETGKVLVPPPSAEIGVISDLDDTVIKTDVLNLVKMARNTFLYNSRTRLPFAGVAQFYKALQNGTSPEIFNPIFYVTGSSWNLYDLLVDFFEVRHIPLGPLFMTEIGVPEEGTYFKPSHRHHKLRNIRSVLSTYPNLPFILIGDSTERDPEIYLQIVQEFPGRVPAIYIRDMTGQKRDEEIAAITEQVREAGSEMLLVPDTVAAAVHAADHGFIMQDSLADIREERKEDKKPPVPVEQLIDAVG